MIFEAKVFKNGNSQAIRLPKECRVKSDKVYIKKIGDSLVIMEGDIWDKWWSGFDRVDIERLQGTQEREEVF